MTCTLAGALRKNFKSSPCSDGRSLPTRVRVLPVPCTFARPANPFSEMAASMWPLYSAALGVRKFSALLGAVFPEEGSTDFDAVVVSAAPAPGSFEGSFSPEFAPELSEAFSDIGPAGLDDWRSLTCALCNARAASKTGLILFAPYMITPTSNKAAKIVPIMLFFFGDSTGGTIVPVRCTMGVCPGEAARSLRKRAVATTVGSSSESPRPASPWPTALPETTVAAGEPPHMTMVELGLPA